MLGLLRVTPAPGATPVTGEPPLIVECLFSYLRAGSERVGANVALTCARRGYRVVCFAYHESDGPIRQELEAAGIECVELNYLRHPRYIRRLTYQATLFQFFRRRRPHVVHMHHAIALVLGALPARLAGVRRIVMTEHSVEGYRTIPSYRRQGRRYCQFADAITVIHPSLSGYFQSELGVPASRLHYIANGVRVQPQSAAVRLSIRHELGIADDEFLWMSAGRLEPVKDVRTLVAAFAIARDRSADPLRLAIVGDGPERQSLEQLCQSLQIDGAVSFLGARDGVPQLMTAADGFVMSSLSEGLPMVLLEAMAARVPCVATAVGGISELLAGGVGLLTQPRDEAGLADAMSQLAADAGLRQRIAEAGLAKVAANNDLERVVDEYLAVFGLPPTWPAPTPVSEQAGRAER